MTDTKQARKLIDRSITEEQFTEMVLEMAHCYGWRAVGFRPGRTNKGWRTPVLADAEGFPDLELFHIGKRRHFYAELKSEKGRLRPAQWAWGDYLRGMGETVYVWHPSDWETIEEVLK